MQALRVVLLFVVASCGINAEPEDAGDDEQDPNVMCERPLRPDLTLSVTGVSRWLLVGDALPLVVTTNETAPCDRAAYTTDTPDIVEVDSAGVVLAKAPGEAHVRVSLGAVAVDATFEVAPGDGLRVPELAAIDEVVLDRMRECGIPGGSVALVKDGRLVLWRGYGLATVATSTVARRDHWFRIGSVSKPLAAIAIAKLLEQGTLSLTDHPFAMLSTPVPDADPRLDEITVRHLLTHTGGWVTRDVDYHVWGRSFVAGSPRPQRALVTIGREVNLGAEPGAHYEYTNYAFQVLGEVTSELSGQSYEQFLRTQVFAPVGANFIMGRTQRTLRDSRESSYYDDRPPAEGWYGYGPIPDHSGGMEYYGASGSVVTGSVDLARVASALMHRETPLASSTVNLMLQQGLGWYRSGATYSHSGGADGGDGFLALRYGDDTAFAALFNKTRTGCSVDRVIDQTMNAIEVWPAHDLFP